MYGFKHCCVPEFLIYFDTYSRGRRSIYEQTKAALAERPLDQRGPNVALQPSHLFLPARATYEGEMEGRRRREGALLLFAERRRRKLITVSCLPSEEEALQSRPLPPAAQKEAACACVCVCVGHS